MAGRYQISACPTCGARRKALDPAWMRAERARAGLSQAEVGRRAGLSVATVSAVETGRRGVSDRLAEVYCALAAR